MVTIKFEKDIEYCDSCPFFWTGRDQLQKICDEGIDLSNTSHDETGQIIIPNDCPYK